MPSGAVTRCDALIVGGGPAGSTCARVLRRAGWHVILLDRARFPRDKVCAGWLTPQVFDALDLEPSEYRATGLTFQEITAFRTGFPDTRLVETRYDRVVSYAIRRCEFDDFLLRRAQVCVREGTSFTNLQRGNGVWIVNEEIRTPVVIGAGGHFCPIARHLRANARAEQPVVAKEAEFRIERAAAARVPDAPELFFCRDLDGYAWCVKKGEYVNVGIGRRGNGDFACHVRDFIDFIDQRHGIASAGARWRGHAYLAAGTGQRPLTADGLMLVGDAAGLAYPESGEGIRPAVESGRLAAEVLVRAEGFAAKDLQPYESAMRREHPASVPREGFARTLSASLARPLMRSPVFTRHVVLDRWFLRR